MTDAARNEIYVGDEIWFTDENSPTFYKGKIVSLDEDFGEVTIEVDAKGNTKSTTIKRFWSVLKPIIESKELYKSFKKEKQIIVDYLGNELQVGDKVIFIWPDCTFQEGKVEHLYDESECGYITVNFGGNFYTVCSNQCIKR